MKLKFIAGAFIFFTVIIVLFTQCTKHKKEFLIPEQELASCYPDDVGKIFVEKCATAGCHNTVSKDASAGLDLSSWEKLFNGSRGGSAVVPYSAEQSFLVNFINTFSDLGKSQTPTMPYNGTPLSREEVLTVISWINDGAPDCDGHRLTDNPDRKKFYITNQGCDLVSVWDAERKVIMRYIKVSESSLLTEAPHKVAISPDGQYWYVSFIDNNSRYFQKYKTSDDSFVGQVDISIGSWNTFAITSDSKWAYLVDFSNSGRVAKVDCENMILETDPPQNPDPGPFSSPHGSAISPDGNFLYITMQYGDALYKMDITSFPWDGHYVYFSDDTTAQPHEVAFSPDGKMYFVTCEATHEVKIFKTQTDQFLKSISVAADPVEMSFSLSKPYLFVTCMNGAAVSIINYQDTSLIKTINTPGVFYKPHGVAVDDAHGICYIVNRNSAAPHHTSVCGGTNGFLSAIDLNTLQVIPGFKPELSVDPYSIAIRK